MIEISLEPIHPEVIINKVKSDSSGCVVTYVGLIREESLGRQVLAVEYQDYNGKAASVLKKMAIEAKQRWQVNDIAICHRVGKLKVGDVNLVVAVAATHRSEGFAVCQYIIDQFKHKLPTQKKETYSDSNIQTAVTGDTSLF
ncbi:molybdenum cofactor biosynthesis protein MoaE [Chloroflexota bacterium]